MKWFVDDSIPNDKIYVIPDWEVWTIRCVEQCYDKEKETTVLSVKSKNYYFERK